MVHRSMFEQQREFLDTLLGNGKEEMVEEFAKGGIIPGYDATNDDVPAILNNCLYGEYAITIQIKDMSLEMLSLLFGSDYAIETYNASLTYLWEQRD